MEQFYVGTLLYVAPSLGVVCIISSGFATLLATVEADCVSFILCILFLWVLSCWEDFWLLGWRHVVITSASADRDGRLEGRKVEASAADMDVGLVDNMSIR